jgi:hypothetical protein
MLGCIKGNTKKWRLILQTPQGEMDATDMLLQVLPHLWRDRFYMDDILHRVLNENSQQELDHPDAMLRRLLQGAEKLYDDHQFRRHGNPIIFRARFEILSRPQIE